MGEYANYNEERTKIGTRENMYYLRWGQAHLVTALDGNVDPCGEYRDELRFRFPFPDEDKIEPGQFENAFRTVAVPGLSLPDGVEHTTVQFVAQAGYNMCIPCPEGLGVTPVYHEARIHRNGFSGAVQIVQQKWLNGKLVLICQCGGCGSKWRVEEEWMAKEIAVQFLEAALKAQNRGETSNRDWNRAIALRIMAGYAASDSSLASEAVTA